MNLDDVPQGERIYIDANIFIYHFSRVSNECRSFLARCEAKQLEAFTGTHVLLEVLHRLMILEALHKGLISGGQSARKLKEKPEVIQGLSDYNLAVRQISPHGRACESRYPGSDQGKRDGSPPIRLADERFGFCGNDAQTEAYRHGDARLGPAEHC